MEARDLKLINEAYDKLYDVVSRTRLFKGELESIENYMKTLGYKVKINYYDKCKFVKVGGKNGN